MDAILDVDLQPLAESLGRLLAKAPPHVRGKIRISLQENFRTTDTPGPRDPTAEAEAEAVRRNRADGRLDQEDGIDCPLCRNRGHVYEVRGKPECLYPCVVAVECVCMDRRRALVRMIKSGLGNMLDRYTFEAFRTNSRWQGAMKAAAMEYAAHPRGWFYIGGEPGTGKTHLCTAICKALLERYEVRYMLWADTAKAAKAAVNDEERYRELVEPLKRTPVLYIDDLFKTRQGREPTDGDVNLAFEIINARYNDERKMTLISCERNIAGLMDVDKATAERIYERAQEGRMFDLTGKPSWRLRRE